MGYIKPEIYQSLCADTDKKVPNVFIETGTFKGGIPARMLDEDGTLEPFKKIYTIELFTKATRSPSPLIEII